MNWSPTDLYTLVTKLVKEPREIATFHRKGTSAVTAYFVGDETYGGRLQLGSFSHLGKSLNASIIESAGYDWLPIVSEGRNETSFDLALDSETALMSKNEEGGYIRNFLKRCPRYDKKNITLIDNREKDGEWSTQKLILSKEKVFELFNTIASMYPHPTTHLELGDILINLQESYGLREGFIPGCRGGKHTKSFFWLSEIAKENKAIQKVMGAMVK